MLEVRNISKDYTTEAGTTRAVADVSFSAGRGEFVAIVGPSGAGKSTVLRALAGLSAPTSGEVRYNGRVIATPPAEFAVVFQDYARSLYPWFSVEKNVMLPLFNVVSDAARRHQIVEETLAKVGLPGFGKKRPQQLSGGQQQRVAIARALAYSPEVLIMDEPFASVDAQTRSDLEDLVLSLKEASGATVIFVTHDVDEAIYMSDRVIVLSRAPSTVAYECVVDLPRTRDQIYTKALPRFSELRASVLTTIRRPVPALEPN